MKTRDALGAAASVLVCEVAGGIGGFFTVSAIPAWYAGLEKSALTPPGWVFGPVWTVLYALMGVAAFLVWQEGWARAAGGRALLLFALQLALNVLWSVVFFGLHDAGAALIDIAALWLAIAACIALFARLSRTAAWLLAPYLAWVSFAAYLNYAVWTLN